MKLFIVILILLVAAMAAGDFKVIWKQPIVTRQPDEFIRYYASNVWLKYQDLNGFAKVSRIWPGSESPLAEAAKACEELMREE